MSAQWIAIELVAALIECTAMLYFANSRFHSKDASKWRLVLAWGVLVLVDTLFTFAELPFMEGTLIGILLLFLIVDKRGSVLNKFFCAFLSMAIAMGASLAAIGLTAFGSQTPYLQIMEQQEIARITAIALSKMCQCIAFWIFSKKNFQLRLTSKAPATVLLLVAFFNLICLYSLHLLCLESTISRRGSIMVMTVIIGVLMTTAFAFLLFDIFVREENTQLNLLSQMQRLEVEENFYKQIDAMYADMRQWRHDYRNHILTLTAMLKKDKPQQALRYLQQMTEEPSRIEETLNTGNMILDALVSTKLAYARSKDIDITLSAIYPEKIEIADTDLCSIVSNLLDNAIEACDRIDSGKRFIDISFSVKRKMMILSVRNSFRKVTFKNGRYATSKEKGYHGLGLKHIDELTERYQGYVHREHLNDVFLTQIILPI